MHLRGNKMQINRVDIGESISNKAVQYTVFIMFSDGTRDTFSINDIDSIRDLKERINAEYSSNITANDIYFYPHGAQEPYQVRE